MLLNECKVSLWSEDRKRETHCACNTCVVTCCDASHDGRPLVHCWLSSFAATWTYFQLLPVCFSNTPLLHSQVLSCTQLFQHRRLKQGRVAYDQSGKSWHTVHSVTWVKLPGAARTVLGLQVVVRQQNPTGIETCTVSTVLQVAWLMLGSCWFDANICLLQMASISAGHNLVMMHQQRLSPVVW